jgi:hypothetical protein
LSCSGDSLAAQPYQRFPEVHPRFARPMHQRDEHFLAALVKLAHRLLHRSVAACVASFPQPLPHTFGRVLLLAGTGRDPAVRICCSRSRYGPILGCGRGCVWRYPGGSLWVRIFWSVRQCIPVSRRICRRLTPPRAPAAKSRFIVSCCDTSSHSIRMPHFSTALYRGLPAMLSCRRENGHFTSMAHANE